MNEIATIVGIWKEGLLSDEEVIVWADEWILESECPEEEMIELSLKGPGACSKKPSYEFPVARRFSFTERFALRAANLNLENEAEINEFIEWLVRDYMGENLDLPEVSLGYHVDHYAWDCDNKPLAVRYLKEEMVVLLPKCIEFVAGLEAHCLTNQSTTRLRRRTKQCYAGY